MKPYQSRILLFSLLSFELVAANAAQQPPRGRRGGPPPGGPPVQAGVYTTVSGVISQFNYDRDAEIEGFLLSNNTLVHLPPRAASRIGMTVHPGDNVQISGYARTSPAGVQTIEAQGVQDRTSGKTFTIPQPGAAAPYSGSGRIEQLNYGPDGAVNGFVLDNGTLAGVPPFSATNPTSVRVGAAITYSGYARNTISGRTVVDVQNLTINGQSLNLAVTGPASPGAPPPAGPQGGPGVPPPPTAGATPPQPGNGSPAPPQIPASGTPPAGRTNEPPPPPRPATPQAQ